MKQEHQVESLSNCICELQQHNSCSKIGSTGHAQQGFIESRQEQVLRQDKWSMKNEVLRDSQIRSMHGMREMKSAQELRVDEVSVQKLRENHQTIQKLTSQLQEMQEEMNSMSDSVGDCHTFPVSLQ